MKKHNSKLLALSLALIMVVLTLFSGCVSSQPSNNNGGNSTPNQNQGNNNNNNSNQNQENKDESAAPEEEFLWTAGEGGIIILEYIGDDTEVIVPEIINNKKVVSIGNTFDGNVVITSLSLPSGVKEFKLSGCDSLKTLTLNAEIIDGEKIEFSDMPVLDELNLGNAKEIYCIQELAAKKIVASNATLFTWNDIRYEKYFPDGWTCPPEEVVLCTKLVFCYTYPDSWSDEETGKWYQSGVITLRDSKGFAITDENRAAVYCDFFCTEEIVVNGMKYNYSGSLEFEVSG